jgi:hypothetical protein
MLPCGTPARVHAALRQPAFECRTEMVQRPRIGTFPSSSAYQGSLARRRTAMDGLIYLIGLIVIIMAILSFFGLR